jgi:hypothetical protein
LTELPQRQQLAEPEQQQPALAGARNSSTTCSKASFILFSFPAVTCQIRQHPKILADHLTKDMTTAGTPSTTA